MAAHIYHMPHEPSDDWDDYCDEQEKLQNRTYKTALVLIRQGHVIAYTSSQYEESELSDISGDAVIAVGSKAFEANYLLRQLDTKRDGVRVEVLVNDGETMVFLYALEVIK